MHSAVTQSWTALKQCSVRTQILLTLQLQNFIQSIGEKIADFDLINNWSLGRINVPESIITFLAKELKVTTDWLLTGKEETDQVIDTHLYKLAKEHEGVLKGFDCLDEEKQKAISKEIADSLELRRLQREAKQYFTWSNKIFCSHTKSPY